MAEKLRRIDVRLKNPHIHVIFLCLMCFTTSAQQDWMWVRPVFDNPYEYNHNERLATDAQGNLFLVTTKQKGPSYGLSHDSGFVVTKYNALGSLIWSVPAQLTIRAFGVDNAGNSYCAAQDSSYVVLKKFDSNGQFAWQKKFQTGFGSITSMCAKGQDHLIIGGYFNDLLQIGNYNIQDTNHLFITELDAAGEPMWVRSGKDLIAKKPGNWHLNLPNCLSVDKNGNCYIVWDASPIPCDYYCSISGVAKLDAQGQVQLVTLTGGYTDPARFVTADDAGNIYLNAGYGIWTSGGSYVVKKFTPTMDSILWTTTIAEWEGRDKLMDSEMGISPTGKIWVAGFINGQETNFDTVTVGQHKYPAKGGADLIAAVLDPASGKIIRSISTGSRCNDMIWHLAASQTGAIFVQGVWGLCSRYDSIPQADSICFDPECLYDASKLGQSFIARITNEDDVTGVRQVETRKHTVHPNPANDIIHVNANVPVVSRLYNLSGQVMKTAESAVDVRDLPPGIYILECTAGSECWRHKVIVAGQ